MEDGYSLHTVVVAVVAAMGGGAGIWAAIKAGIAYMARRGEDKHNETRADKDQIIKSLEEQLAKAEARYDDIQDKYATSAKRIETLLERSNKSEIEQARLATELKYLELRASDFEARNKELERMIDAMRNEQGS